MEVTFYGVRGSCPCSGEQYVRYGGNTSCVLVRARGEDPLVLDMGTGLRGLGELLAAEDRAAGRPLRAGVLLTHLHFDHVMGLPFFAHLLDPAAELTVHGPSQGHAARDGEAVTFADAMAQLVRPPYFPVPLAELAGRLRLVDTGDDDFALGGAKVRARAVPHPGHTLGFRIELDGQVVAYVPDHQAPDGPTDQGVLELCDGADLLIHDAQYTEDDFVAKSDWGHSTAAYAVRLAAEAGVRRLQLFHHDPFRTDDDLDRLVAAARALPEAQRLEDVSGAREGVTINLEHHERACE